MMHVNMLFINVNDILDLRLIEEGKFEPKIELFSPVQAFKFILSVLSQTSIGSNQDFLFKVASAESLSFTSEDEPSSNSAATLPDIVSGDKIRMTQVLINLAKMAQKFQRQSGG